jgi:hypothetical protein
MSKINQIEKALIELGGGAFQKLADAYLHKKGYDQINPLGSVVAADKTRKGTPDTLITLPSGKFVFAEHTTRKENLIEKLKSDLEKCLTSDKTGIPVDKIAEVVFCHTSLLSPEEENELVEICQKHEVNLNIFGLGPISFDLYQKYPWLARDFLGIEVDTGQIVPTDEFVTAYGKNKLSTRLDTTFHFREKELSQIMRALDANDVVIIAGRAGVGKTRLALECCYQFKKTHSEFSVKCIFNRGQDLSEDIRVYFSESGHFLILVDDANRVSRFDYFVYLIQNQREDQKMKIIATVRDYALKKIQEEARTFENIFEIELQKLEDDQIKQLVKDEYSINNYLYLDRIAEIAQGNPRLATMVAEVAKRENTLQSINDVSALYEKYFASIRDHVKDFNDDLIKTASIVVFFRIVDRSRNQLVDIEEAFKISPETFWDAAQRLHALEILDMYENEIVRISDQVLGTYLFYYAFFKKKALDFSTLLTHFFPTWREQLIDAINPVLNSFDSKDVMETMRTQVDTIWHSMEKASDEEGLLHLINIFWFLKPTDALIFVKKSIDEMESKSVVSSKLEFKPNSFIPSPSLLSIIGSFGQADESNVRIAIGLLLDLVEKRPSDLPQALYLLTDRYGFEPTSDLHGFFVEKTVIEILWERTDAGKQELFSRIYIHVAKSFLHTRFHTHKSKGRHAITWIEFELPPTPHLLKLRKTIWEHLFQLYRHSDYQKVILDLIRDYCSSGITVDQIVKEDSTEIVDFLSSELESTKFANCRLVQQYLDFIEERNVPFDEQLRTRFTNETYEMSKVLLYNWAEKRTLKLKFDEYQEVKKEQIHQHFAAYDLEQYKKFFEQCREIDASLEKGSDRFQLVNGLADVLSTLADQNPELYNQVLEYYIRIGDPLKLNSVPLIQRLLASVGVSSTFDIIREQDFPTKRRWQFAFFASLDPKDITSNHLGGLYSLYEEAPCNELPFGVDFLLRYRSLDKDVVAKVTKTIVTRANKEPHCVSAISLLFDPHSEANKILEELFAGHVELLEEAYFKTMNTDFHYDLDGQSFARILNLDPDFILKNIDRMFEERETNWISKYEDTRDYSFLWLRNDYESTMARVVKHLYEKEKQIRLGTYLFTFFHVREDAKRKEKNSEISCRQHHFLENLIKQHNQDSDFMVFIFNTIAEFPPNKRRHFISLFLKYNKKSEDFKRLRLEPMMKSYNGSAVPSLQEDIDYFESLLPLANTVELLQHKQLIERHVQYLRSQIEFEKKRDFIEE